MAGTRDSFSRHQIDVAAYIDAQPLSGFQVRVALLCASVLFLESFDSVVLGYIAPTLTRLWRLAPGALGPVFASGFLGQLLGALIAGPVADRVGRKAVLVAAVVEFACGALLTTQVGSLGSLLWIRLLTGVGIGAALPNVVALCAEYSPARRRSTLLVLALCGITFGSIAAGLVATRIVPALGWTGVFWVGGLAPLLLLPALIAGLRESPYWLALRGGARDGDIAAILGRIGGYSEVLRQARFIIQEERSEGLSVTHLVRDGRGRATALLWVIAFMSNLLIYFFASWLPTLARATGLTEEASVLTGVALNVGGLIGTLTMGWVLDRFRIERVMAVTYAAAAGCIALLAAVGGDRWLMGLAAASAGFCIVGGQTGANALIAYRHPTYIRATALAWALGWGRVASILGPLAAGWIIALGWSARSTFRLAAVPAVCACLAVWWLGERVWRQYARQGQCDVVLPRGEG